MQEKENLKMVLVGHIDHGKSTLIGRLFYDTESLSADKLMDVKDEEGDIKFAHVMDHLKEERDQGITIDTAQTYFSTDDRNYTIIDAPGHKEFIKNMITGASQAEAGVLVIDADEGVMPQTKRHAYILSLLGIDQVVVAMNKMDLVGRREERYEEVKGDLEGFLDGIGIDPNYVIPISAEEGDNVAEKGKMDWYDGPTVLEALESFDTKPEPTEKPLRFPVQDVYDVDGEEVVVGKVESGTVKEGDTVKVLPRGVETEVEEVKEFGKETKRAEAGESKGLVLSIDGAERGDMVSDAVKTPKVTEEVEANIFWINPDEIEKKEEITFKCTTQESEGVISEIKKRLDSSTLEAVEEDADRLGQHEVGEVVISLEESVVVDEFNKIMETGRFVIDRNRRINGGGIVVM
ncbi:MAG: sulfate adenylyltransferase subunit 1 [Candidatus Aenigmatarchaeota archaeon]